MLMISRLGGTISTCLLIGALLVASLGVVAPTAAQAASLCDRSQVDIARAKRAKIATLKGVNARIAKDLVRSRKRGEITQLEDLRELAINDRRFLSLVRDDRACFAGRSVSDLLPNAICAADDARINTGSTRSLAKRIGYRNARLVVAARPIESVKDIAKIPDRGRTILSRAGREGGTCLDPILPDAETSMGAGTVLVGVDIVAGRYVAQNVDDCYWERGSAPTSKPGRVIGSRAIDSAQQVVADISTTDVSFTSEGCGVWVLVSEAELSTVTGIPGDGDWLVGSQVAPGIYRAASDTNCTWARQARLSGLASSTISTASLPDTLTLIEVQATDAAFTSTGCGAWSLVPVECMNQLEAIHPAVPEVAPHIYGVSDSVLLSTRWEMEMTMVDFNFNWGGFGGLNTRDAPPVVEVETGEGMVTGTTVIVGVGHNIRGPMLPDYPGYVDALMAAFPDHVDRVIWVAPSRFNTLTPQVVTMLNNALDRWPQLEIADFWVEGDAQNHPEWFLDDLHHDEVGRQEIADYLNNKLLFPCGEDAT